MDDKKLKLYRLTSKSASYDDLANAVVWAYDEYDAWVLLAEAFRADLGVRMSIPGSVGDAAWPYEVTEVKRERGIVLAETREG